MTPAPFMPVFLNIFWIDALFALFTERHQRAFELLSPHAPCAMRRLKHAPVPLAPGRVTRVFARAVRRNTLGAVTSGAVPAGDTVVVGGRSHRTHDVPALGVDRVDLAQNLGDGIGAVFK
jgi:hypothetical protein